MSPCIDIPFESSIDIHSLICKNIKFNQWKYSESWLCFDQMFDKNSFDFNIGPDPDDPSPAVDASAIVKNSFGTFNP